MKSIPFLARWYSWTLTGWLLTLPLNLAVWSLLLCPAALSAMTADFHGKLTLLQDQLTVRIVATPLQQVMEEISRLSGAQVLWLHGAEREQLVSVEFTALPLAEALQRILTGKSFMLFYASTAEETHLRQIWISSQGKGQPVFTRPPVATIAATSQARGVDSEEGDHEEHDKLASVPIATLMEIAMGDENPSVRLEAIVYLEGRAGEDPRVQGTLTFIAQSDSDWQVKDAAAEVLQRME